MALKLPHLSGSQTKLWLTILVTLATISVTSTIILYGMFSRLVTFSGTIDIGVIVGVMIVTGIAAIFRFLYGTLQSNNESEGG